MSKFGLVVCLLEMRVNFGEGMCYFGGLFNFQLRTDNINHIHYGSHVPVVITINNFTTTHVPIVASEKLGLPGRLGKVANRVVAYYEIQWVHFLARKI